MGELKKRVITGLCTAPVIAFLFYILPQLWFLLLLAAVCAVAVYEAARLAGASMKYIIAILVILGLAPLYMRFFQIYMLWVMAVVCILIIIRVLARKTPAEKANRELMAECTVVLFGNFFIVLPFFYIYVLKELENLFPLILLFSIWASDIAAYFIGKNFGKHPLAPQISPKKTIEGLFGSILGSMVIVTAAHQLLGFTMVKALIVGAAMGVLGQAGDLLESSFKRVLETKDSSSLLPGHGGLLDRIDSFTFTAPFLYICLVWTI